MKVIGFAWTPPKRATSSASNSFRLRSRTGFLPARKRQERRAPGQPGALLFSRRIMPRTGGRDFRGRGNVPVIVIPSPVRFLNGARNLFFPRSSAKSRSLASLGMTNSGCFRVTANWFRPFWRCPFRWRDARQRRARTDRPHSAIGAAGRRCAPTRPG